MTELMPDIVTRAYARANGLDRYFTGKPCIRGHLSYRYTGNKSCAECAQMHSTNHKNANREDVNRKALARYHADPEKSKAYNKRQYYKDPAAAYAKTRAWAAKNPDAVKAASKRSRAKHGEKMNARVREWRSRNVDKQNFYSAKRYARKIAAVPIVRDDMLPAFQSEILAIYAEARTVTELTGIRHDVDHIFPISKGGVHAPWNLRVLLGSENQSKKDKWPEGEPVHVMWHGELMSRVIGEIMEQNHGVS